VSAEEKQALVRRFFVAQAKGDLHALDEMMAPDFVDRSLLPGEEPGREGYKRAVAEDHAAFSNLRYIIEDQVTKDDKVISRLTIRRIHDRKEFAGIAPTGREFESTGIVIHRIAEGKIAEEWSEGGGLVLELTQQRLEQQVLENERIEQELRVARRIQEALLPKAIPKLEDWEITHYYRPAHEVGGDFYDFHPLSDGQVGFVIGDVSGKGVPAAVMMANTQSVLRAVAQREGYTPGQILAEANEVLYAYVPPNTFVTCFYAILDPQSGRFRYANAGHNLPCCRHGALATELRAKGMPLGLMPEMSYEEKETILVPDDGVLFYSDGLVEAHNSQGVMFGAPHLRNLLARYRTRGTAFTTFLLEELERFTGEGWEQEDDITLVTLQRSPIRAKN
jgi:serine phosphatase RsbU (regulator of sigma subunit)/predicted ester cyclase